MLHKTISSLVSLLRFHISRLGLSFSLAMVLYPYGEEAGDTKTPKEDDGTSPEINLTMPVKFFGKSYKTMYVSMYASFAREQEDPYRSSFFGRGD